jgi:hypothetical protein
MACALLVVPATSLVQIQVIRGPAARGVSEPPAAKAGSGGIAAGQPLPLPLGRQLRRLKELSSSGRAAPIRTLPGP